MKSIVISQIRHLDERFKLSVWKTTLLVLLFITTSTTHIEAQQLNLPVIPQLDPIATNGAGLIPSSQFYSLETPYSQINVTTGNVFTSIQISHHWGNSPAPNVSISLYHNSNAVGKVGNFTGGGLIGEGWSMSFGTLLQVINESTVLITTEEGNEYYFNKVNNKWYKNITANVKLKKYADRWELTDAQQVKFVYNLSGSLREILAPSGNMLSVSYDALNRIESVSEHTGREHTFHYNAQNYLETIVDEVTNDTWTLHYNAGNEFYKLITDQNDTIWFDYNAGKISSITGFSGEQWDYEYYSSGNFANRFKKLTLPDTIGASTLYTEVLYGEVTPNFKATITDVASGTEEIIFDNRVIPRIIELTNQVDETWQYKYNNKNKVKEVIDPLNHKWTMTYDVWGRLASRTDPLLHITSYEYDNLNNLTLITDPGGFEWNYRYEDPNDPTAMTQRETPSVLNQGCGVYDYDYYGPQNGVNNGQIKEFTDPEGFSISYNYDGFGQILKEFEGPETGEGRVEIDRTLTNDGMELDTTYAATPGMSYASHFPELPPVPPALQSTLTHNGTLENTWWNAADIKEVTIQSSGLNYNYTLDNEFDDLGRLTERTKSSNFSSYLINRSSSIAYDDAARQYELETPNGEAFTYTFDEAYRLVQIRTDSGLQTDFTYHFGDQVETVSRSDGSVTTYQYYSDGAVQFMIHQDPSGDALYMEYIYNDRGLPTQINKLTVTAGGSTLLAKSFGYDERSRLTSEEYDGLRREWEYDRAGNRTKETLIENATLVKETFYHYDYENPSVYHSNNNRLVWYEAFDGASALLQKGWFFYNNTHGHVEDFVVYEPALAQYKSIRFQYSETGHPWRAREVWWQDSGSGPYNILRLPVLELLQEEFQVVMMRLLDPNTGIPLPGNEWWCDNLHGIQSRYTIDGTGTDQVMDSAMSALGRISATQIEYYLHDCLGSLLLGTSPIGYEYIADYSAFGMPVDPIGSAELGFCGAGNVKQEAFGSAFTSFGLNMMGARWYFPDIGRFTMRDPMGTMGGENLYVYVDNVPTAATDFLGLAPQAGYGGQTDGGSKPPPSAYDQLTFREKLNRAHEKIEEEWRRKQEEKLGRTDPRPSEEGDLAPNDPPRAEPGKGSGKTSPSMGGWLERAGQGLSGMKAERGGLFF